MSLSNTRTRYGPVARGLHWLIAILVLAAFPLGLIAHDLPFQTDAELARKARIMSLHKTLGVSVLVLAALRIAWSLTQPKPSPVDHRAVWANRVAAWVHGSLLAAIAIVPLSGWLHHAATTGFAPILWPFGQSLPFVPQSEALAGFFGACHWLFTKLIGLLVLLHISGALKHAVLERDGTLARMISGRDAGDPDASPVTGGPTAALLLWAMACAAAVLLFAPSRPEATTSGAASETGSWRVEDGTLEIGIRQMGQSVTGTFGSWTALIEFDATRPGTEKGTVVVTVDMGSLTLGSVTSYALNPEFLDAAGFPEARFNATILEDDGGYSAKGTLDLKGTTVQATLPFSLKLTGDLARAEGELILDRRAFSIGQGYADETSLGFPVIVSVDLTARKP